MKYLRKYNESYDDIKTTIEDSLISLKDDGFEIEIKNEFKNFILVRIKKSNKSPFNIDYVKPDFFKSLSMLTNDLDCEVSYIYTMRKENGANIRTLLDENELRELSGDTLLLCIEYKINK